MEGVVEEVGAGAGDIVRRGSITHAIVAGGRWRLRSQARNELTQSLASKVRMRRRLLDA